MLQLHDLQGNIVATAVDNEAETKLYSTYNSTEFGVPSEGKTPPKYAWLGAGGVASETAFGTGVSTQGGASYVPQVARELQTATIGPPGAFPNGQGTGEQYDSEIPGWYISLSSQESAATLAGMDGLPGSTQEGSAGSSRTGGRPRRHGLLTGKEAHELAQILIKEAEAIEGYGSPEEACGTEEYIDLVEACELEDEVGAEMDRVLAGKLEWRYSHIKGEDGVTRTCYVSFGFSRVFDHIAVHYDPNVKLCFSEPSAIGHWNEWYCKYTKRWYNLANRGWWESLIDE